MDTYKIGDKTMTAFNPMNPLPAINRNWSDEDGNHQGGISTGMGFTIAWQRGPIKEGDRNGAFLLDVLGACRSQLEYYQEGKYSCVENAIALEHVLAAIDALESRKNRRNAEGVLGAHEPDIHKERSDWKRRAAKLREGDFDHSTWCVGQTDMEVFDAFTGIRQHYAYGPQGQQVEFLDDAESSALEKAVLYAEQINAAIDSP
jgi:hypothetical protein